VGGGIATLVIVPQEWHLWKNRLSEAN